MVAGCQHLAPGRATKRIVSFFIRLRFEVKHLPLACEGQAGKNHLSCSGTSRKPLADGRFGNERHWFKELRHPQDPSPSPGVDNYFVFDFHVNDMVN